VSVPRATLIGGAVGALAVAGGWALGPAVLVCLVLYASNNVAYSLWLKHLPLLDVLSIAIGFVLRLLAGVYVVGELPTTWITLCAFFLALFLGFGKRRAELRVGGADDDRQRPVLSQYPIAYLDYLVDSTAVMAVICYALFTTSPEKNRSLVMGVPIVFYAIMHYKRLVMRMDASEEPERVLLRDTPIRVSIVLWLVTYLLIEHGGVRLFR
jgi:4-hydroxybenzoate polyprenyltransferase